MKTLFAFGSLAGAAMLFLAPAAPEPAVPARAAAPMTEHGGLDLEVARAVLHAAESFARERGAGGAIAVVDAGGNVVAVQRLNGTFPAASNVSIGKARTAAMFRKPTSFFEDVVNKGRTAMTALPDFTPLRGGVPIVVDGETLGAVGVSGASSAQEDEEMASAAAEAARTCCTRSSGAVTWLHKEAVSAAFQKGEPLFETEHFKVHASRREGPGRAEVHVEDTDILYVLEGSATFVTGGRLVDGEEVSEGELRGSGVEGGESRQIGAGDVLVVPAGTPHWFREVEGPLLYYVVKTS